MKESRLYSFIDKKLGFTLHLLEGTKLISDLNDIHNIGPNALDYYRQTVLTAQQMITFLKPGENLGVYIDSEEPYFRFKIETNNSGLMRTLLLPEEFSEFPKTITGMARISKVLASSQPYTSVIKLENEKASEVINNLLKESYQTNSKVIISDKLDQSIMITKLPKVDIKKVIEDTEELSLEEYISRQGKLITEVFSKHSDDIEYFVEKFESKGMSYLGSKEVKFFCPCSKERMLTNILTLGDNDLEHVFSEDDKVEIRCDYCNTLYEITKEDAQKH